MTEPRGPAHVDCDIRSPFRSYFRIARDLIVVFVATVIVAVVIINHISR